MQSIKDGCMKMGIIHRSAHVIGAIYLKKLSINIKEL